MARSRSLPEVEQLAQRSPWVQRLEGVVQPPATSELLASRALPAIVGEPTARGFVRLMATAGPRCSRRPHLVVEQPLCGPRHNRAGEELVVVPLARQEQAQSVVRVDMRETVCPLQPRRDDVHRWLCSQPLVNQEFVAGGPLGWPHFTGPQQAVVADRAPSPRVGPLQCLQLDWERQGRVASTTAHRRTCAGGVARGWPRPGARWRYPTCQRQLPPRPSLPSAGPPGRQARHRMHDP